MFRNWFKVGMVCVQLSFFISAIQAQALLNIDFGAGTVSAKVGFAATGRNPNDYWNFYTRDDGHGGYRTVGAVSNLKWADGSVSAVGLTVINAPGAWHNGAADPMYDVYLYPFDGGNITLTLSSLPVGSYDFYLYGHGGPGVDTANSVFKVVSGSNDYGTKPTTTTSGWTSPVWQEGQQYVVFRDVAVVQTGGSVRVTVLPGAYGQAFLSGMQIVPKSSPPPPPPVAGSLLNVDFGAGTNSAKIGLAATGQSANDFWNFYSRDDGSGGYRTFGGVSSLKWADGSVSAVELTVANAPGAWHNGAADPMYDVYLYPFDGGNITVTLRSLPVGNYDVYLYGHGGPGVDTANSFFRVVSGGSDFGTKATTTTSGWTSPVWQEGQQYVVFRDTAVVNAGDSVTVTVFPGAYGQAFISGMQVLKKSSTPPPTGCVISLAGLVGWWKGDGGTTDAIGSNNGTLVGNASFAPGVVGQAFSFDGDNDSVMIGNPTALQLQDFSIEAWIKRSSTNQASLDIFTVGHIFGYGYGGYVFALLDDGRLTLGQVGLSGVNSIMSIRDTNWHHVAVSKASGTVRFYVDGVGEAAPQYNPRFYFISSAQVGASQWDGTRPTGSFLGLIDEVSVYDRALSGTEVLSIYAAASAGKCPPISEPPCTQPPSGLVSWWKGEGNGNDAAGANDSTLLNGIAFSDGKVGQAFSFNGNDSQVRFGNAVGNFDTNDFTVEFWTRTTSTRHESVIEKWPVCGYASMWAIRIGSSAPWSGPGRLEASTCSDAAGNDLNAISAGRAINDGLFHHVAFVRRGTDLAFYIDGVRDVATNALSGRVSRINNTANLVAGRSVCTGIDGTSPFTGQMDEVSVYNHALSESEIRGIYNAGSAGKCQLSSPPCITPPTGLASWWPGEGSAKDVEGRNDGTLSGVTFTSGKVGQAFDFNGNDSQVRFGNTVGNFDTNDFTIDFWIRTTTTRLESLIEKWPRCGASSEWYIRIDGSPNPGTAGRLGAEMMSDALFNDHNVVLSQRSINDGLFHHVAFVRRGTNIGFYIDGVLDASSNSAGGVTRINNTAELTVGRSVCVGTDGTSPFTGQMDEISVYSRALSADEIDAIYHAGTAGKCAPPMLTTRAIAHWKFDETSGAIAHDSAGPYNGTLSSGGAAFFSGGVSGGALRLNKTNNGFVSMGNVLGLGNTDFSIVAWIKMSAGDTSDTVILSKHAAYSRNGYLLDVNKLGVFVDDKASFVEGGSGVAAYTIEETPISTTSVNDGNWHQVVATFQSGGVRSIYVDGAPAENTKLSQPFNQNSVAFLIGAANYEGVPTSRFDGLIDEVQIYNYALVGSDVDFLFQHPDQEIAPRDPAPGDWRLNTLGNTGGTITREPDLLKYTNGATVTVTAVPAAGYVFRGWSGDAAGTTNPIVLTMTGNKTVSAGFAVIPVGKPLAHWTFDETGGGIAHDSAGSYDGVLSTNGASFVTNGIAGNALSITKSGNGFVNMGSVLGLESGDFSVLAWVKMTAGDTTQNSLIVSKQRAGYANGYLIAANRSEGPTGGYAAANKAWFYDSDFHGQEVTSTNNVNDGNWHQIVGVYVAGANKYIYVDGAPAEASNASRPIVANPGKFVVGGVDFDGTPGGMFSGLIDDVQIYNYALNLTEVDFLFSHPGQAVAEHELPVSWVVKTSVSGVGSITRDPELPRYPSETNLTLTAIPGVGFAFIGWSGDVAGTNNPITIALNSDKNVTARFIDVSAPAVTITSPQAGTNTGGEFQLSGTVSDNVRVQSVRWEWNGQAVGNLPLITNRFSFSGLHLYQGENRIRVIARDAAGNEATAEVVVTWRPVAQALAHWKFDEADGTVAHDSSGSYQGTLSATGASFVPGGKAGNALSLSKTNNGLVSMGNVLGLGATDFSIVAWIRMAAGDTTDSSMILSKHAAYTRNGYAVEVNKTGGLLLDNKASFIQGGSGVGQITTAETPISTTSVNDGNWHQIIAVYQVGGMKSIYVDGAPAEDSKPSQSFNQNSVALLIGGANFNGVPTGLFTGLIDEVQIYNYALTVSDVDFLFANPSQVIPDHELPVGWTLNTAAAGGGTIQPDPDLARYPTGTNVTLTAVANTGFAFVGWSGDASGTNNPVTLSMDRNKTVTASFAEIPLRVLAVVNPSPKQEGDRIVFDLKLSSPGDVGGMNFILHYDPVYLKDPNLDWSPTLGTVSALDQVNYDISGEIHAVFALPATAVPTGIQQVASVSFRARSVPNDLDTALGLDVLDVSAPTGNPIVNGNAARGGVVRILRRQVTGDNNANNRLDVGDATIIQRLLIGLDPTRSWDVTGNDVNGNTMLDSGDIIRVLRVVAEIDPQPGGTQTAGSQSAPLTKGRLGKASSTSESVGLLSNRLRAQPGDLIIVQAVLQDVISPISGASFTLDYPTNALRLLNSLSLQTGSLVPASAVSVWNVQPAQNNYTMQNGKVSFVASSATPWASKNGVLAEFVFQVQPGQTAQYRWPVRLSDLELTADGYDVRPVPQSEIYFVGRDPIPPDLRPVSGSLSSSGFSLSLSGESGVSYSLEVSSDLTNWSPLFNLTAGSNGTLSFVDPAATNSFHRFYRAKQQ